MIKKVVGYFMMVVILNLFPGLLLAVWGDCPTCSKFGIQQLAENKVAPPFSLKMADGSQVSLTDFKGKPVMFTFWASW